MKMQVTNWGRYPVHKADVLVPDPDRPELPDTPRGAIVRGLGRCYGDSALADVILSSRRFNRILAFDRKQGWMRCEAGVNLAEVLDVAVPGGWFLPVTPGTKYVTAGGAVASDVHGKNHHVDGCFTRHVEEILLLCADGEIRRLGPHSAGFDAQLFRATCGGMGLTGMILEVAFRLRPVETDRIAQKTIRCPNLAEVMRQFENHAHDTYSVAWIDCLSRGDRLGRSVLMLGEHATVEQAGRASLRPAKPTQIVVPFDAPPWLLNRWSIRAFNALYYAKAPSTPADSVISYEPFFYPLDKVLHWNRLYGSRGFLQYQFVLPLETGYHGMEQVLSAIASSGYGSFLAVLKLFGDQDTGLISFPRKGYTLALDFPLKAGLFALLDRLDQMIVEMGGRIYLAKDARMSADTFAAGYPGIEEFRSIVRQVDPEGLFASLQSKRLGL